MSCLPVQDSSLLETKLIYESQIVELNARVEELEEQLQNKENQSTEQNESASHSVDEAPFSMGDSVNLIKTKHDYESIIDNLNVRIQQLIEENRVTKLKFEEASFKESSNAELQTSMVQNDLEMTFTLEDRINLLETKVAYEKQIVDLGEKIEELQSQIDESAQQASTSISQEKFSELTISSEDSFSIDRQLVDHLLDAKQTHEAEIANLTEKLSQLSTQIAENEAKEQQFNEQLESAKQHHEANVLEQEGKIESMTQEVEILKNRLGQQDAHYTRLVGELESTIADLRGSLSECHEKYELSLLPEHENLKRQFQEVKMQQLESESANQQLLASITDMDEQRNALRGKLQLTAETAAKQAEELEELRTQLQTAQRQLEQTAETTLPRLEQLETANRILSDDLTARYVKVVELEAENEQLKTALAQSDLSFRETDQLRAAQAESFEQQLTDLKAENQRLEESATMTDAENNQLKKEKSALEETLSKAQEDASLAQEEAKRLLEEQLTSLTAATGELQGKLSTAMSERDSLLLPVKEKLIESVEKFTKMTSSITKLIGVIKTSRIYKETVPSDTVKKILYNIRYKYANCLCFL